MRHELTEGLTFMGEDRKSNDFTDYAHGDDWHNFDIEFKGNFSSNVWFKGPNKDLIGSITKSLGKVKNYPAPNSERLIATIAGFHNLDLTNVVVTNGATEAFYLIANVFRNQSATIFYPTFSEYLRACGAHQIEVGLIERKNIPNVEINASLAFICNPNNPDGLLNTEEEIKLVLSNNPETTFVLDEAYVDFILEGPVSCVGLLSEFDNLIIVKSLTKLFAIPGLRLGYILCNEQLQKKIRSYKMPWNVNSLAIEAGHFIFNNYHDITPDHDILKKHSKQLKADIKRLEGYEIISSSTHYFLIKLDKPKAGELKQYLAGEHHLLIRDASNFYGLDQHYIRICPQSELENQLLIKALSQWSQLTNS